MNRVHIMEFFAIVLAMLVLVAPTSNAEGNLYRWTDEEGNQVNSDRPPPGGIEYEVISTKSSMVRKVDSDGDALPAEAQPSQGDKIKPEDSRRTVIEKNPELCARARDNLAQLDTKARIRLRNEAGEVRFLTEDERTSERDKAIGAIESYCE